MNIKAFFVGIFITTYILIALSPTVFSISDQPSQAKGWKGLIISEIFPNPQGRDKDKEWIKIYNSANTEINLQDWIISDSYGHISPYLFTEETWLEDDDYIIIERKDSNIILNNFLETISLFSDKGELADQVTYIQAPENSIYTYKDKIWQWENANNSIKKTEKNENNNIKTNNIKTQNNWEELNAAKDEEVLTLSGVILTLPGQIASQYFLLSQDEKQSQIAQIYNYNKEFPEIAIGKKIEVSGRFSKNSNLYRLKTNTPKDIQVKNNEETEVMALEIKQNLNEKNLGKLFNIKAKITKVRKNSLQVKTVEENNQDITDLELDTSLLLENFSPKQILEVKGILKSNSQGYIFKIIPEYGINLYTTSFNKTSSTILSNTKNHTTNLPNNWLKIFILTCLLTILIIWFFKKPKRSIFDL